MRSSQLMKGASSSHVQLQCTMAISLQGACEDYIKSEHKDGDFILVALSGCLGTASQTDEVQLLLQEQYKAILVDLGWDILSLVTTHLPPAINDITWKLVDRIVEHGSPKEMCLALSEQMETLSSCDKTTAMFNMLQHLKKALIRVTQDAILTSSLCSVSRLVQLTCSQLQVKDNVDTKTNSANEMDTKSTRKSKLPEDIGGHTSITYQSPDVGQQSCDHEQADFFFAVNKIINFMLPFVDKVHYRANALSVLFSKDQGALSTSTDGLKELKIECLSVLLHLLDYPLVNCSLTSKQGEQSVTTRACHTAASVMSLIVKCHYSCVQLLSNQRPVHTEGTPWPAVGVAFFAYLLLVEETEGSYLPSVLNPEFVLSLTLTHVKTLILRTEDSRVVLKGLALLEKVAERIQPYSLTTEVLENEVYLRLSQVLTGVMVSCSNKTARQKSVSLLSTLINTFAARGRHRVYSTLLHSVSHSGVVGLLIHNVKNEVDNALKDPSSSDSPFLGDSVSPLLKKIFMLSTDMDLMEELDRVMASLNFLRYLLIRDSQNMSGIWSLKAHIQDSFLAPVRQVLTNTKLYCKQELEAKRAGHTSTAKEGPEVTVEVSGERLPKLSDKEELQMLQMARNHMDMLESVLVRVEELVDQRT